MVASARVGSLSPLGLSRDDEAELEGARPWLGAPPSVWCDLAPGVTFTVIPPTSQPERVPATEARP